jgi:hypothetical protein
MRKISLMALGVLICAAIAAGNGMAQTPPNIKVALALEKATFYPDEPIKIVMTLANQGGNIITSKSFLDEDFHIFLRFTGEDGIDIASNELKDMKLPDPPPPRVLRIDGNLVQVEIVEVLAGLGELEPWVLSMTIADARNHYSLTKGGKYLVKAVIPMGTYPGYETVSGMKYARIDSANWSGALESNTASFTLVADADGDGYYYPLSYGAHPEIDCDDSDPLVNPGRTEIANNGKDDDCNPATPDLVAIGPGDLNSDGKVDCADLALVRASFGKRCGQAGFDPRADTNKDCVIDVRDLAFVSRQLVPGTRCP